MTFKHYDIEKSRRVEISIPGYDPVKESNKINEQFKRMRDRQGKKAKAEKARQAAAMREKNRLTDQELADLNKSLAVETHEAKSPTAKTTEKEEQCNIFL